MHVVRGEIGNIYVQNSKEGNQLGDRIQQNNVKADRKEVLCSEIQCIQEGQDIVKDQLVNTR